MSEKEFQEMIELFMRLQKLMSKSNNLGENYDSESEESPPIIIPNEIYDDICKELGSKEIRLMGIS